MCRLSSSPTSLIANYLATELPDRPSEKTLRKRFGHWLGQTLPPPKKGLQHFMAASYGIGGDWSTTALIVVRHMMLTKARTALCVRRRSPTILSLSHSIALALRLINSKSDLSHWESRCPNRTRLAGAPLNCLLNGGRGKVNDWGQKVCESRSQGQRERRRGLNVISRW